MTLKYWDYELTGKELDQIKNDAVAFAEDRLESFEEFSKEFLESGEDFLSFYSDIIKQEWAEFEYDEFTFEKIWEVYPEDVSDPLPQPFASDLDEYAKDLFTSHVEKLFNEAAKCH